MHRCLTQSLALSSEGSTTRAAAPTVLEATASVATEGPGCVGFGAYDPLASRPLDGVGKVQVNCDAAVGFSVSLGAGGGTFEARTLSAGSAELGYNLYTDAARATVWGDGISGDSVSSSGTLVDLPIYGRIPALQNIPAGSYADTITVTVSY